MRRTTIAIFCLLLLVLQSAVIYAQQAPQPAAPKPQAAPIGKPVPAPAPAQAPAPEATPAKPEGSPTGLAEPAEEMEGELEEVFFSSGAISPDGQTLYVLLDRSLAQYAVPSLELKKKVEIGIPSAPVTPTLFFSKDGRQLYVIQNATLFQINAETLKVEQQKKLMQ